MLNARLTKLLSPKKLETLCFYPDFLPYQMDKAAYWHLWQQINDKSQGSYFYSDGITVSRVGFFQFAFETIKGWFGFSNYCDSSLVQLSMKKLSYYGYVQGFNESKLFEPQQQWDSRYRLPGEYINKVLCPRSDTNSAQLQEELLKDYQYNTPYFSQEFPCKVFGQSYIQNNLHDFAGDIDPQDTQTVIPSLLAKSNDLKPLKNSTLYREYLHHLLKQTQRVLLAEEGESSNKDLPQLVSQQDLKAALSAFKVLDLDPTLKMHYVELFIVAHLIKQEYQEAAGLLEQCALDEASLYIERYYNSPSTNLTPYLQEGTALAKGYSQILANKACEVYQKSKGGWFNSLFATDSGMEQKPIHLMKQAIKLDSQIINQYSLAFALIYLDEGMFNQSSELLNAVTVDHLADHQLLALYDAYNSLEKVRLLEQDSPIAKSLAHKMYQMSCKNSDFLAGKNATAVEMILHLYPALATQFPNPFFKYYVGSEQWDLAYAVFTNSNHKNSLDNKAKTLLSEHFNNKGEILYKCTRNLEVNPSLEKAEFYKKILDCKRNAFELSNTPEAKKEMSIHCRLYAKQLAASVEQPMYENPLELLERSIQLMKEATTLYPEDNYLPTDYAKVCLQYVALLRESCCIENKSIKASKLTQNLKTQQTVQIMQILDTFIEYAEKVSEKNAAFKRDLAEVYFQRAECIEFFKLYDKNNADDYLQAATYAPDNAFYALRYSDQCSSPAEKAKFHTLGMEILTQMGLTETDYVKWRREYWLKAPLRVSEKGSASQYYPNYPQDLAEKKRIHAEKVFQVMLNKLTPRIEEVAKKISNIAINTLKYDLKQPANKPYIERRTQIEQYGDAVFKNLINQITSMGIGEFSSFTFGTLFDNPAIKNAVKASLRKGAGGIKLLDKATSHSEMYRFATQIKEKIAKEMVGYLSSLLGGAANKTDASPLSETQAQALLDALDAASVGDMRLYEGIQDNFTFLDLNQMQQVEFKKSVLNNPTPNQALQLFFQRCYEVNESQDDKQSRQEFLKFLSLPQEPNILELLASHISPKQVVGVGAAFGGIDALKVILDPGKFIEKTALNVAYNPSILTKGIHRIGSLFSSLATPKPVPDNLPEEKEMPVAYEREDYDLWKKSKVEFVSEEQELLVPGLN